jgi:hypothetical protein
MKITRLTLKSGKKVVAECVWVGNTTPNHLDIAIQSFKAKLQGKK